MTRQITKSKKIIQYHVVMSMGAGAIPFAGIDMLAVGSLQLGMLKKLCVVFDESFENMSSEALICTISGTATARIGAAFIKTIPIIGTAIGSMSMSLMAGASTYALGQMFVRYLDDQVLFKSVDANKAKLLFMHYYQRFLKTFKKKAKTEYTIDALVDLIDLRREGVITEQSFQTMKAEILNEFVASELPMDKALNIVKKLAEFRDSEALTEEEFDLMKEAIFNKI